MNRAETLDQLYSPGTPLSEVKPEFRGMSFKLWRSLKLTEQCNEQLKTADYEHAPLKDQRGWTPRDDYGRKSTGR